MTIKLTSWITRCQNIILSRWLRGIYLNASTIRVNNTLKNSFIWKSKKKYI
jgi:endogenous inhibitor of DNA gyrase (YacG/DUF329 family)